MCSQQSPDSWGPASGWATKDDTLFSCPHTTAEDYKRIAQVLQQRLLDFDNPRTYPRMTSSRVHAQEVESVCIRMGPIHVCDCATIEAALACLGLGSPDEPKNKGLCLVRLKCGGRPPPPCPCPGECPCSEECTGYQGAVYRNDVIGVLREEIASLRWDLESKNLQIKKMCECVDYEANFVRRIAFDMLAVQKHVLGDEIADKMACDASALVKSAGRLSSRAGEGTGDASDDE